MKLKGFIQTFAAAALLAIPAAAQTPGTQPNTSGAQNTTQGTTGSQDRGSQDRTGAQGTTSDRNRAGSQVGDRGATDAHGTTGTQSGAHQSGHTAGAAGESMVGKSDHQFMTKAAQSGMAEVKLAEMAEEKAASQEVKEYARKLKDDHQKANEQLKQIAEQRGVTLPSDPGQHQQMHQRLANLSGEEFDRAFMRQQVQHHKKDIKEFQKQANRGMDSAVKDFASSQLPVLQEHLRQAEQLNRNTGTRSRQADHSDTTTRSNEGTSNRGTTGTGQTDHDKRHNQHMDQQGTNSQTQQQNPTQQRQPNQ